VAGTKRVGRPIGHRIVLDGGAVILDLWWEHAQDALSELASYGQSSVDAWYLDGFSPNRNREMWTDKIFHCIADLSREGATFATFTAAGDVRRALLNAGFQVTKRPGFGKKRECIHGVLKKGRTTTPITARPDSTPWDICSSAPTTPHSVLVIGAGIAGCTAAAALARRGHSPLSDFSLQSYLFALRFYQQLLTSGNLKEGADGALCGSFHQSNKIEEMAAMELLLQSVPDLAQVLSARAANDILGVKQDLLEHENIQLLENTGPVALQPRNAGWAAVSGGQVMAEAACAVVATGTASTGMCELDWLPLQAIRGQTTTLAASENTHALRAVLCHSGYISPARTGEHCIGATFDIKDEERNIRALDHRKNLDALGAAVPNWQNELAGMDEQLMSGRVGYRCASPIEHYSCKTMPT